MIYNVFIKSEAIRIICVPDIVIQYMHYIYHIIYVYSYSFLDTNNSIS